MHLGVENATRRLGGKKVDFVILEGMSFGAMSKRIMNLDAILSTPHGCHFKVIISLRALKALGCVEPITFR